MFWRGFCPTVPPTTTQDELFPDLLKVPPIVRRIWAEILAYHATDTPVRLTQRMIAERLERRHPDQPCGLRTVQRAFHDYRKTLLPWPVWRGQRPPWEPQPEQVDEAVDPTPIAPQVADHLWLEAFDEHGEPHTVEAAIGPDGILRVIADRAQRLTALIAAAYAAVVLLDSMDGHVDHVIHWCRVISAVIHTLG
jgi:hypothetical protein